MTRRDVLGTDARHADRLKGLGVSTDAEAVAVLTKLIDRLSGACDVMDGLQDRLKSAPDGALARAADQARWQVNAAGDALWAMRKSFQRHERRAGRERRRTR